MLEGNKTKQTVILIGAGANADFRLQKGQDLIAEIQAAPSGIQRVIKPKFTLEDISISMPTGEQLVKKIADENELIRSVCFSFLKKFISTQDPHLDQSTLDRYADSMCRLLLESIGLVLLKKDDLLDSTLFLRSWQAKFPTDNEMSAIAPFVFAMLEGINFTEKLIGTKEIRSSIIDKIKDDYSHYFELSELVRHYQPFSIDELLNSIQNEKISTIRKESLNSEKELVEAGKVLIANYLLQAENEKTFQDFESVCWYRHLRNMIVTSGKNHGEICEKIKQLTIISFNYDRSLDYFLRTKLSQFYEDLKQRIIYPYGDLLGAEDNKNPFSDYELPYGFLKEEKSLSEYQKKGRIFEESENKWRSLQIIGEISDTKKEKIGSSIKQAGKLYFFGFSFNQENCEVLGLFDPQITSEICHSGNYFYYTNFGNSKKIEEKFKRIFKAPDLQVKVSSKGTYDALAEDFDLQLPNF